VHDGFRCSETARACISPGLETKDQCFSARLGVACRRKRCEGVVRVMVLLNPYLNIDTGPPVLYRPSLSLLPATGSTAATRSSDLSQSQRS
jgi:hypothetical protein